MCKWQWFTLLLPPWHTNSFYLLELNLNRLEILHPKLIYLSFIKIWLLLDQAMLIALNTLCILLNCNRMIKLTICKLLIYLTISCLNSEEEKGISIWPTFILIFIYLVYLYIQRETKRQEIKSKMNYLAYFFTLMYTILLYNENF